MQVCVRPPPKLNALLIGNNLYRYWRQLSCCHNDVDILARLLSASCPSNMLLAVRKDLIGSLMQTEVDLFFASASPFTVNLLFFAGHGVETGQVTFLLPIDAAALEGDRHMNLSQTLSIEMLKRRFRCKSRHAILIIILACCRYPVHSDRLYVPLRISTPQQISGEVVLLHACEPGDEILDSTSVSITATGESIGHSTLAIAVVRALILAKYGGWKFTVHYMDVLNLIVDIALHDNSRTTARYSRKNYPCLLALPILHSVYKMCGFGAVPDSAVLRSVSEMEAVWRSSDDLPVHPQARNTWLSTCIHHYLDDWKTVQRLRAFLGDLSPLICLCIRKEQVHAAAEVMACGQIIYRLHELATKTVLNREAISLAETYAQRGFCVLLTTTLDLFVQANFLICFAFHLKSKRGTPQEELTWKQDAWQLMLFASTTHQACGITELSLANFLSAMHLRLQLACRSAAEEVEQVLRNMSDLDCLSEIWSAEREALLIRAMKYQGKNVSNYAGSLLARMQTRPAWMRENVLAKVSENDSYIKVLNQTSSKCMVTS